MNNFARMKDLTITLPRKEMLVRYNNLAFGYFWSLANPLASVVIFYFIFQKVLKMNQENYALFLVSGVYAWQWLSNSLVSAPLLYIFNLTLIKKTIFPRFLLPAVSVLQDAIHFLLTIPIICVVLVLHNKLPGWSWLIGVPVLFLNQLMLTYALSLFLSTLNVFFRDIERFVSLFLMFVFYLTPVLYSEDKLFAENYDLLVYLNPLALCIINWRNLFLSNTLNLEWILCSFIWSASLMLISQIIHNRLNWRFAEVL